MAYTASRAARAVIKKRKKEKNRKAFLLKVRLHSTIMKKIKQAVRENNTYVRVYMSKCVKSYSSSAIELEVIEKELEKLHKLGYNAEVNGSIYTPHESIMIDWSKERREDD